VITMKIKTGNVEEAKTVRAGCGMRYDPEQLGDETGFDFPGFEAWKSIFGGENIKTESGKNRKESKG